MRAVYQIFIFLTLISIYLSSVFGELTYVAEDQQLITTQKYMFWPNATVPFYVNPEHFDHEQSLKILTALSMFAFKTCLKFAPVMALPSSNEHVMVFVNPAGVKRCVFETTGHSFFEPHLVTLGYDCLQTPHLEMIIMKSLGFPFEHNRSNRDEYIDIMLENVNPGATEMFTKEVNEPVELRILPYDYNSIMHFGIRAFSRNGHRTIIFKDPDVEQKRDGLTPTDIRKFDIIYGPECRKRDRQEKIELCQSYPGVARRKRDTEQKDETKKEESETLIVTKSLRVNPHITPPADVLIGVDNTLKELGIVEQVQNIVDNVYKVSESALTNARTKYCKVDDKPNVRTGDESEKNSDILGIINLVSDYAKGMVDKAVTNLTEFCEGSKTMEGYLRVRCDWEPSNPRCRGRYYSTKNGPMQWSTQHRPIIPQSTRHERIKKNNVFVNVLSLRDGNSTDKEGNVETNDGGETGTTEKMVAEKSILRFGATGPPRARKSLQRRRGVIKIAYNRGKTSSENAQSQRNSNEENENKEVDNTQSNEESMQVKDSKPKVQYERDLVLNEELKINSFVPVVTNPNNRFKIKNPKDSDEIIKKDSDKIIKKRYKKLKNRDNEDNVEHDDREKPKMKHREKHRKKTEVKQKKIVQDDDDEEVYTVKKQNKRQKKIKEADSNADGDQEQTNEKQAEQFVPKTITLSKQNKEFYKDRKWPGGVVRYVLKTGLEYDADDVRQRIEEVNNILKERTCVRLKEITESESENVEDFILIDDSPDYVTGRVGGRQNFGSVELLQGGQHRQHTAMMVMAMLGFYFEIARHDRDKYIRVHLRHVRADKLHHFEKIRSDATFDVPYDYKSATHPAWQFWRQYGRSGISTVATFKEQDPEGKLMKSLGQNSELLSETDILKINSVYGVRCFLRKNRERNQSKEGQQRTGEKLYKIQYAAVTK